MAPKPVVPALRLATARFGSARSTDPRHEPPQEFSDGLLLSGPCQECLIEVGVDKRVVAAEGLDHSGDVLMKKFTRQAARVPSQLIEEPLDVLLFFGPPADGEF